jgi:DNA repair photolyase
LNERILAVNTLLDAWWQVGLRFMPLIKCKNYEVVYDTFLDKIVKNIDIAKIYSIFIGWLLYTHKDYNIMLKKQPYLRILHQLEKSNSDYYREDLTFRKFIYDLFNKKIQTQKNTVCMDCLA